MLRNILQRISHAKEYIQQALKQKNIFEIYQNRVYSHQETVKSFRFALASNATDYKHFVQIEHYLSAIISYFQKGQKNQQVQHLLSLQQQALWITPKYVLYMFQKYLERVVPTNITYYHFIREKQFITQYVAIKYILVVGFHRLKENEHVLIKMKTSQKLQIYTLLLQWLITLVYYRCSAIYIKSDCIDPLIYESHLLLSVLLGYQGHSILSTLTEGQMKDATNKMLYIEAFILSMSIPTKKYLNIQSVLNTMRKILTSCNPQKIFMYFPSYLYSNLIGFIKTPYTTQIIYRLLIYFIGKLDCQKQASQSGQAFAIDQNFNKDALITECWSILCLLVEQYDLDKKCMKEIILKKIDKIPSKSIDRSFLLRIANNQHLDLEDDTIRKFITSRKQPYLIANKVIKPQLLAKNYHIVMEHYYLRIIIQASKGRWQKIETTQIWQRITAYNKYEVISLNEYLQQAKMASKGEQS